MKPLVDTATLGCGVENGGPEFLLGTPFRSLIGVEHLTKITTPNDSREDTHSHTQTLSLCSSSPTARALSLTPVTFPAINHADRGGWVHQPPEPVVGEASPRETLAADAPDGSERQVLLGRGGVVSQVQRVRRLDHLSVNCWTGGDGFCQTGERRKDGLSEICLGGPPCFSSEWEVTINWLQCVYEVCLVLFSYGASVFVVSLAVRMRAPDAQTHRSRRPSNAYQFACMLDFKARQKAVRRSLYYIPVSFS